MVWVHSRCKPMSFHAHVPETCRFLLQILFWLALILSSLAQLGRLHHHWNGVYLAASFTKECRRRGLLVSADLQR